MKENYIIIDSFIYKLKVNDMKRLAISTQTEVKIYTGNKLYRNTNETTDEILKEIESAYKPIGKISGFYTL